MDKFQAEAIFCKGGKNCEEKHVPGTWSTIYDQSYRIELENGLRFLANFKYTVKPEISNDPTKDGGSEFTQLKTGDYGKFDTHCDKTMIGFVQTMPSIRKEDNFTMQNHRVQCFYGEQETHYDLEKTVQVKTESDSVKVAVITNQNKIITDSLDKPKEEENVQIDSEL